VLEKELEYWRRQLGGVEALELPIDHPRPAESSYRGAAESFVVERELAEKLRELSRREGVTLFVTLLAAFQTLLYRYTGQEDIVVGTPIANRNRLEIEGLIGFFVNTLALRVRLSTEISFRDLLHRVRETALAAYSHDQVPFERLVVELSPKRTTAQNPLFQVWFFLNNNNGSSNNDPIFPGLTLSSVESDFSPARLDLTLTMSANFDSIVGAFTYATDLFEPETIITLTERFQSLLYALACNPDCKLLDIPFAALSENQRPLETHTIISPDEMQTTFAF
jgi:non-ribosomal peptide synthetase component F